MFGRSVEGTECLSFAAAAKRTSRGSFASPLGLITPETFSGTDEQTLCKKDTRGAHFARNTVHI